MEEQLLQQLTTFYEKPFDNPKAFGTGLINHTWRLSAGQDFYIIQKINTQVFQHPGWIDENLKMLAAYFKRQFPQYLFTAPLQGKNGQSLIEINNNNFRCFAFVNNSHTVDVLQSTNQAFEAAVQFGKFTALLNNFDASKLHITLPHFHNLALRYQQFENAIIKGNQARKAGAKEEISFLISQKNILERWQKFIVHQDARQRVTHHDTKISNVLFDESEKGICVIDLDTVMPGFFISDVGDMLRTYICPVSEEEKDLDKIIVRKEFIDAIKEGYFKEMKQCLTQFEQDHFLFAGKILMYMQALRFLTDYLNNDIYYGKKYETHNLLRTQNQIKLLQSFSEKVTTK